MSVDQYWNIYVLQYKDRQPFPAATIEGFYVTSYQANFASHYTNDRHVGFLSAWNGIGKHNKMSFYFLFSSNNDTKL